MEAAMTISLMEGNEAIGRAAVAAGCTFFAGYPITPATTIYNTMLSLLPPAGGVCLQGEDEIASIGFCLGASMAGRKVMTATSGPGISLYSEQISFAIGSEIPIVIVDVQRLGPSTGSATKGADGDVQFLRWGNSGGLPVVVLAPVDVADCYRLTAEAFNIAESLRCPVFIATNKEIAMTRESVNLGAIDLPPIQHRAEADRSTPFLPFAAPEAAAPPFLPIAPGGPLVRQTSSTHGPDGYITASPQIIAASQRRLKAKVESRLAEFTFYTYDGPDIPDTLVITYGVSARAARDAVAAATASGSSVGLLVLKTLWPVPEAVIQDYLDRCGRAVVVEMNLGQYVREIRRVRPDKTIDFIGEMNGELISPERIRECIVDG
jgi:2-oxoglutarate ferredoxin oxidoreductase subunit alpha